MHIFLTTFYIHFLEQRMYILIEISLDLAPAGPIKTVRMWCQQSTKPLPEPIMTHFTDVYIHRYASISLHEYWYCIQSRSFSSEQCKSVAIDAFQKFLNIIIDNCSNWCSSIAIHYFSDTGCVGISIPETEMSSGWLPWSSLGTLKLVFSVSSEDQGSHSHPHDISVSVIVTDIVVVFVTYIVIILAESLEFSWCQCFCHCMVAADIVVKRKSPVPSVTTKLASWKLSGFSAVQFYQ